MGIYDEKPEDLFDLGDDLFGTDNAALQKYKIISTHAVERVGWRVRSTARNKHTTFNAESTPLQDRAHGVSVILKHRGNNHACHAGTIDYISTCLR